MRRTGSLILFFSFTLFASGQEQYTVPLQDISVIKWRNFNSRYLLIVFIESSLGRDLIQLIP